MNKYILVIVFVGFFSCNDGDLEIETIDFDSIETIEFCDEISVTEENLLFKINGDEALILELPSGLLLNEITTETITSDVSSASEVTYRIFSDDVTSDYFCDAIPATTPMVLEDITAEGGQVLITTTTTDSVTFEHTIQLSGISFVTENGSRITNLEVDDFGTVTTSVE